MIKVSVLYPKTADAKFDMGYYCEKHMPMVMERFGQRCKGMSVDEGLSGGAPGSDPTYVAAGHFLFDSVGDFQEAFQPHAAEIMSDISNYTSITPVIQVSQVRI